MNTRSLLLVLVVTFTITLAACQSHPARPPSPSPTATTPVPTPTPTKSVDIPGAIQYRIDSAASRLHILVYRGGTMARLGHNHVVSSGNVSGVLYLHDDISRSRVELALPVKTLVVDDPKDRASEGEGFAAEVPIDAREGTRRNLLRPEVLDGERYPTITLHSTAIAGTRAQPQLTMRITIKGNSRDVTILPKVQRNGSQLTASGEFTIKQTAFGIAPFSVALGALRVQDQLRIKFSIVCLKQ